MPIYIKTLTIDERAIWGDCPVCGAKHGEPCDPTQGVSLGVSAEFAETGPCAHAARLLNAPQRAAIADTGE